MIDHNELIQQIANVLDEHYPVAYECSDCGTHLECSCGYSQLDSWTTQHVSEQIAATILLYVDDVSETASSTTT